MQLFIREIIIQNNKIIIKEKSLIHQLLNVLRVNIWYKFFIQEKSNIWLIKRYLVQICKIDDYLELDIIETINKNIETKNVWLLIPFLNKFEKIELLVQKITEIWIDKIILYLAKRSMIKQLSENKLERLNKIILEAVEQSKWWILPEIQVENDFNIMIEKYRPIVFDQIWKDVFTEKINICNYGIIWPEGWFDESEIQIMNSFNLKKINIWENILRAETAWIIWWWILKNIHNN